MTAALDRVAALSRGSLPAEAPLRSAGHLRAGEEVARADPLVHLDAADGHLSPALLFPGLVARVRLAAARPLHVHIMVEAAIVPERTERFADAGADLVSVHAGNGNVDEALDLIERCGLTGSVVFRLETPVAAAAPFVDRIAMLTLPGTRSGVNGPGLDPSACDRLRDARALAGPGLLHGADGGTVPGRREPARS